MARNELNDYRWLASENAEPYLARAADDERSTVALIASLRKDLSPARVHLVAEQIELRKRARRKFHGAERMVFTRQLLEQATDEQSARYKASRFPRETATIDLCCGLGGDLLALAQRGPCLGIDIDPVAVLLANTNCRRLELASGSAQVGDARTWPFESGAPWHIDPDRRGRGSRSIHVDYWEPDGNALRQLIARHPAGAIKLAPATELPADFAPDAEREWIGQARSCRQQIAWIGDLSRRPSMHTATVLGRNQLDADVSVTGLPDRDVAVAPKLGDFVHEPHAAVLAGRLTGALAEQLGLAAITRGVAYLTSDRRIDDDARLATFEVVAAMPFDLKQVKSALRARSIGRLEIKHRGLRLDPDLLRKRLHVPGDNRGCLIIVGGREPARAILAQRRSGPATDADAMDGS